MSKLNVVYIVLLADLDSAQPQLWFVNISDTFAKMVKYSFINLCLYEYYKILNVILSC